VKILLNLIAKYVEGNNLTLNQEVKLKNPFTNANTIIFSDVANFILCLPWFDDISLHVHFDQAGGSDLVVKHSEWIQQKFFSVLTQAHLKRLKASLLKIH